MLKFDVTIQQLVTILRDEARAREIAWEPSPTTAWEVARQAFARLVDEAVEVVEDDVDAIASQAHDRN